MGGDVTHITQVPPSTILWSLAWGEMLTAELAWHQQQPGTHLVNWQSKS